MQITRAIIGAVLLFLGRELNFLFAGGMAVLVGFRLLPMLPRDWPGLYYYAFLGLLALVAAGIALLNERIGYFLSGFLAGGYLVVEYYAPGLPTVPWVLFLLGAIVGSLLIGFLTEWAVLIISCMIGAYYVTSYFNLPSNIQILVTAALFVIGALVQAVLWYMQKN